MGGVFGKDKKPASRITEQDQAILKLKKQRDQLKQYQKRIEGVLEKDRLLAKKLLQEGKKERAKLLLRKKKYQEGLLARTDGQLDNLERLTQDLEFAQIEKQPRVVTEYDEAKSILECLLEGLKSSNGQKMIKSVMPPSRKVLDGLKTGSEALKKANDMFSIEEIEAIMDDTAEAVEKQREIDALLAGQLSAEDEDDVLKELEELTALEEGVAAKGDDDVQLPDVPTAELPENKRNKAEVKTKKIAVEAS